MKEPVSAWPLFVYAIDSRFVLEDIPWNQIVNQDNKITLKVTVSFYSRHWENE